MQAKPPTRAGLARRYSSFCANRSDQALTAIFIARNRTVNALSSDKIASKTTISAEARDKTVSALQGSGMNGCSIRRCLSSGQETEKLLSSNLLS